MLVRGKLVIFGAAVVFALFNCFKLVRKHSTSPASVASVSSPAPSPVPPPPSVSSPSSTPSSSSVRCSSWGSAGSSFWGFGDGLIFRGSPDFWDNGEPCYLRSRGFLL